MYALFMTVIGALTIVVAVRASRGRTSRRRNSTGSYPYTGFDGTTAHHQHHGDVTGGHHHGTFGGHDGGGFSGGGHHG